MKIRIEQRAGPSRTDKYAADILDLSGSPTLGFGATKEEAVAHVFQGILLSECYRADLLRFIQTPIEFEYK